MRIATFNTITTNSSYMTASSSTNQNKQQVFKKKKYLLLSISLDDLRILKKNKKSTPRQISILDQKIFSSNSLNISRQFQNEIIFFTELNNKSRQKKKSNVKIPNDKNEPRKSTPLLRRNLKLIE